MCLLRAKVKNAFFRIAITYSCNVYCFNAAYVNFSTPNKPTTWVLFSWTNSKKMFVLFMNYIVIDFIIHVQGEIKKDANVLQKTETAIYL